MWPFVMGGMQMHTYRLTGELLRRGVTVDLYHPSISEQDQKTLSTLFNESQKAKFSFHAIEKPSTLHWPGHYLRESYLYSQEIWKTLSGRKATYDIIYIQGFSGWAFLKQPDSLKMEYGISVINFHGLEMYQKAVNTYQAVQFFIFRFFVRKNLIKADYVQSLGGKLNHIIRSIGIPERKIVTCAIGIPSEWIRTGGITLNKNKKSFAFIGRFEARKGLGILLQAFEHFIESNPDAVLTVIGEVPSKHRIELKGVTYLGNVVERETIRQVLDNCNFLVLPSMSEGLPTVVLEAMARGCIVLAPRIGALGDVLTDANSILIEQVDPSGVEETLQRAIRLTEEQLLQVGETAVYSVFAGFTWDNIAEKMIGQFNQLLRTASRISDRV